MAAPTTPTRAYSNSFQASLSSRSPEKVPEPGTPNNIYQAKYHKKRFSIKGLLAGDSKKERSRQMQERGSKASNIDAEADTVYHVDVDDRTLSVNSAPMPSTPDKTVEGFLSGGNKSYMLKVVLLLMDPETRRFELLQLEFDSDKALVSDVLTQIPVAVTEDVLKKQLYIGICGSAGKEMSSAILLSEFCKGNDVLVAVPDGVSASECARLARPILNDDKVINMLKASGIDASAWKEEVKAPEPISKPREMPTEEVVTVDTVEDGSGGGIFMLIFVVFAAVILQIYHSKITAPIAPGQVLSPGGWISRCGVASVLPSCENSYLQMGDDGVLSLLGENGELEWKMEGAVCKTDDCINGLEMREDSKVAIGGKVVSWVNVKKNAEPISPWPFAAHPKLKVIHAKK